MLPSLSCARMRFSCRYTPTTTGSVQGSFQMVEMGPDQERRHFDAHMAGVFQGSDESEDDNGEIDEDEDEDEFELE